MISRFFSLFLLLLAGCHGSGAYPHGDGDDLPRDHDYGDRTGGREIELLSEPYLVLEFGRASTIRVRLLGDGGRPVPDHPVNFTLHGRANNSTLSDRSTRSDESGYASITLTAGSVESTFSVRVFADGFEPVHIAVTVSIGELAAITVLPRLDSDPSVAHFRVFIMSEVGCDSDTIEQREYDRVAMVPVFLRRLYFPYLPVHRDYALAVEALSLFGDVLALDCAEVRLAEPELVSRIWLDERPTLPGERYRWHLDFDAASHLAALRLEMDAIVHDERSEGELWVDALLEGLLERGFLMDHSSVSAARPVLTELLDLALDGAGLRAPVKAAAESLADLDSAGFYGELILGFSDFSAEATPLRLEVEGRRFTRRSVCVPAGEPGDGVDAPQDQDGDEEDEGGDDDECESPLSFFDDLSDVLEPDLDFRLMGPRSGDAHLALDLPELWLGALVERYLLIVHQAESLTDFIEAAIDLHAGCEIALGLAPLNDALKECDAPCLVSICESRATELLHQALAPFEEPVSWEFSALFRFAEPSFATRHMTRVIAEEASLRLLALDEEALAESTARFEAALSGAP